LTGPAQLWAGHVPSRPEDLGLAGPLARRIEADLFRFSLPVLLRYEDRNTMAFGVESRVPFVDHVFVEWMATLPAELRLDGGWTKRVMRDALRGTLPEKIRLRRSKLGFSTPQEQWIRGALGTWVCDVVSSSRHLLDLVERDRLARLVGEFHRERGAGAGDLLCRLAIYDTWARRFIGA
jgi:asparagine synthase (glutamine-hydrolysing)